MKDRPTTPKLIVLTGIALSVAGALTRLSSYANQEMRNRNYPSWEDCRCDFKAKRTIFLVCYSRHRQQGETIISQEWCIPLHDPPTWLRRVLHHSAQLGAIFNPTNQYVERILIHPQQAQQFALQPHATTNEENMIPESQEGPYIIWRREVLHIPRHLLDVYTRRLYPVQISWERQREEQALPALWDATSNMPLPSEGTLLDTPTGTRIDYIGWTPSQISYCTARNVLSN